MHTHRVDRETGLYLNFWSEVKCFVRISLFGFCINLLGTLIYKLKGTKRYLHTIHKTFKKPYTHTIYILVPVNRKQYENNPIIIARTFQPNGQKKNFFFCIYKNKKPNSLKHGEFDTHTQSQKSHFHK